MLKYNLHPQNPFVKVEIINYSTNFFIKIFPLLGVLKKQAQSQQQQQQPQQFDPQSKDTDHDKANLVERSSSEA